MFVATSTSTEITTPPPPPPPAHVFPVPVPVPPPPPPPVPQTSPTPPVPMIINNPITPVVVNTSSNSRLSSGKKVKDAELLTHCTVCGSTGTSQNIVMLVINYYFFSSTITYQRIDFY